jgi:hypothetical protein
MTEFKTQVLKSPLNQKMNIWFFFYNMFFCNNIDNICESLFSKKKKKKLKKHHVVAKLGIFILWHKKRDIVVCIYPIPIFQGFLEQGHLVRKPGLHLGFYSLMGEPCIKTCSLPFNPILKKIKSSMWLFL